MGEGGFRHTIHESNTIFKTHNNNNNNNNNNTNNNNKGGSGLNIQQSKKRT